MPPPLPGLLLLADCLAWPLAGVPRLPVPHPMLCSFTQFKSRFPVRDRAMRSTTLEQTPHPNLDPVPGSSGDISGLWPSNFSLFQGQAPAPALPPPRAGREARKLYTPPSHCGSGAPVSPKCSLPPFPGEAGSILIPAPGGGEPGSERAVAW